MSFTSEDSNSGASVCLFVASSKFKVARGSKATPPFSLFSLFGWTKQSLTPLKQHLYQPVTECLPDTLSLTFQGPRHRPG